MVMGIKMVFIYVIFILGYLEEKMYEKVRW